MPLVSSTLKSALQAIFEGAAQSAKAPPQESALAQQWASAMFSYGGPVAPPSASGAAAQAAMQSALAGFSQANQAATVLETAFAAFAASLATGMTATGVFSLAKPPTGPVGFADVFGGTFDDARQAAQAIADKVDTWMKTGTATNATSGATIPWS